MDPNNFATVSIWYTAGINDWGDLFIPAVYMGNIKLGEEEKCVHSFLQQCFAQSSVDTNWGYFQLIFKLNSADISWKYPQIRSTDDCAKYCFKKEWTLVTLIFEPFHFLKKSFCIKYSNFFAHLGIYILIVIRVSSASIDILILQTP